MKKFSSERSQALAIIKPDAINRNLVDEIKKELSELSIVCELRTRLSLEQAELLYLEHKEKEFYYDLCSYMISDDVLLIIVEANDCVAKLRNAVSTIRKKYALSIRENSIHGSDSESSAQREIDIFWSLLDGNPDHYWGS